MKRETMRQENYHYRRVFTIVFFCALFVVGGLFLAASPAFASHFSMTLSATSSVIDQGGSVSFVATATCNPGPCSDTLFSFSNLPPSSTATPSTSNCAPTCSTIITINSSATTPYGFYTINISGTDTSHSVSTPFNLIIGYNIKGWAWSDGIGWISFNSENCDTNWNGVMDSGDTGFAGCPLPDTTIHQYGVHLDLGTLVFSGSAWSENIGWITFNKSDAGTPPAAPFNNGTQNYIAKYNPANGMIEGWARATSCPDADCGTDWGWIKMSGTATNGNPYGAHYTDAGGNRDFDGFAWGDLAMSWISFNSTNCDTDSNGFLDACGSIGAPAYPYKVWVNGTLPNGVPTASNLETSFDDRCVAAFGPKFTFVYSDPVEGSPLAQYVIRVYEQGGALADTILVPVGFKNDGSLDPIALNNGSVSKVYTGSNLSYGGTYYFTVTVQDEAHLDVSLSSLPVFTSGFFKTDPHQRPQFVGLPNKINWSPSAPFASSTVTLTASSTVYVGGAVPATSGNSIYLWTIATSTTSTFNSTLLSPQVVYPSSGNFNVTVKVTDQSGNACYNSDSSAQESCSCRPTQGVFSVAVSKPKPVFREVKP